MSSTGAAQAVIKAVKEKRGAVLTSWMGGQRVAEARRLHAAVQRHPPRHATTTTPRGQHSRQYWALQPNATGMLPRSDGEWVEALDAVLEGAISRQRRGTGRIGSMLSGGMDSTALAMIAADQLQAAGAPPLPTFSAIDSSHADCPETRAVLACIQRPGLQPHLFDIARPGTLQHELDSFLDGFDEPFDMGMALLDAQYLGAARTGVDAVIDGECGTEPTTVVDLSGTEPVIQRVGAGDPAPFEQE